MATLRQFLDDSGFDWSTGIIVVQPVSEDAYCPGWASGEEILPGSIVSHDDSLLDEEFDHGYGAPQCPRYVARDATALYFPSQYDGATAPERLVIDLLEYLRSDDQREKTPYPGG